MEFNLLDEGIEIIQPAPGIEDAYHRVLVPRRIIEEAFLTYIFDSGLLNSLIERKI